MQAFFRYHPYQVLRAVSILEWTVGGSMRVWPLSDEEQPLSFKNGFSMCEKTQCLGSSIRQVVGVVWGETHLRQMNAERLNTQKQKHSCTWQNTRKTGKDLIEKKFKVSEFQFTNSSVTLYLIYFHFLGLRADSLCLQRRRPLILAPFC